MRRHGKSPHSCIYFQNSNSELRKKSICPRDAFGFRSGFHKRLTAYFEGTISQ